PLLRRERRRRAPTRRSVARGRRPPDVPARRRAARARFVAHVDRDADVRIVLGEARHPPTDALLRTTALRPDVHGGGRGTGLCLTSTWSSSAPASRACRARTSSSERTR